MSRQSTIEKIKSVRIIPVIRAGSPEQALRIAQAVYQGGISIIEITMTVPDAVTAIDRVHQEFGDTITLGAGTVLIQKQAVAAIQAGAEFIVSPNLVNGLTAYLHQQDRVAIPGTLTPTEIIRAWQEGADFIKVFPCGNLGGPKYIKALRGPFPDIPFMPTGGVNLNTIADYFRAGAVAVGVGTDLVDSIAVKDQQFELITENAKKFVEAIKAV